MLCRKTHHLHIWQKSFTKLTFQSLRPSFIKPEHCSVTLSFMFFQYEWMYLSRKYSSFNFHLWDKHFLPHKHTVYIVCFVHSVHHIQFLVRHLDHQLLSDYSRHILLESMERLYTPTWEKTQKTQNVKKVCILGHKYQFFLYCYHYKMSQWNFVHNNASQLLTWQL